MIIIYSSNIQPTTHVPLRDPFQTSIDHNKKMTHASKKQPTPEKIIQLIGIIHINATYGALVSINRTIESVTKGDHIDTFCVTAITPNSVILKQGKKVKILTITPD